MKGAIFDVDGTLLDSMGVWWGACDDFLNKRGIVFSEEKAQELNDMRLEQSIPLIIEEYELDITPEEAINELKAYVDEAYRTTISLKPYAKEYLQQL